MKKLLNSLAILFGKNPTIPDQKEITKEAQEIHLYHQTARSKEEHARITSERQAKDLSPKKWLKRRWIVLITVNLLFSLSYFLYIRVNVQFLEGSLTGSRFVGFHMADLNAALQIMLAFKMVLINLLIGTITVFIMWWLLGGRTFCSWVCPYHLLSEWAEILHLKLRKKKIVKEHPIDRRARTWLWLIFIVLAIITGYTVYESISPTGILSRALIYGPGIALVWVGILLLFEIFYSRRGWCRYFCPIGLTYGLVGATSPMKVRYELGKCYHDGACRQVCLVPHVLDVTKKRRATEPILDLSADCTRCGKCIDACPTNALNYKFKGLGDIL
jgi:ferredoxin-type protein NapH